jgi:IPT/TIG domain
MDAASTRSWPWGKVVIAAAAAVLLLVTAGPAGAQVTVTGSGLGTARGSSYLTFSDNGTNWGAPSDLASFTIDSWSDSAITFTVPTPSGTNGQWAVTPVRPPTSR